MRNPKVVEENTKKFDQNVAPVLEKELEGKKFINGDKFSAVDVFVGYSLALANTTGLLENHKTLKEYAERIKARENYVKSHVSPKN